MLRKKRNKGLTREFEAIKLTISEKWERRMQSLESTNVKC